MPINALVYGDNQRYRPTWDYLESRKDVNAIRAQENALAAYPEERNWQREARGQQRTQWGQQNTLFQQQQVEVPFKREDEALAHIAEWGPKVTYQNYQDARASWIQRGVNPSLLPDLKYFDEESNKLSQGENKISPEEYFELWKNNALASVSTRLKRAELGIKSREVSAREEANRIREEQGGKGTSPMWKSVADPTSGTGYSYQNLNDPTAPLQKNAPPPSGQRIEVDKDGNIRVIQGPGATQELNKPAATKLQEEIVTSEKDLQDLEQVKADFKREYLTYKGRAKRFVLNQMSRLEDVAGPLDPEEKKFVQGSRKFTQGVEQFFNKYRKEITGANAVMKELEMLRDSVLNKDVSPDEFEASYEQMIGAITRSLNLKKQILREGFKGVDAMKELDKRFFMGGDTVSGMAIDPKKPMGWPGSTGITEGFIRTYIKEAKKRNISSDTVKETLTKYNINPEFFSNDLR